MHINGSNVQAQSEYCIIEGNYSSGGGGGISQQYGIVSLKKSIIRNNISKNTGGGISIRVGDFEMEDSIISYNITETGDGGGIRISAQNNIASHADPGNLGCNVKIRGGTFEGNEAINGNGGGMYITVYNSTEECNVDITGGKFIDNFAKKNGGGIFFQGGNLTINEEGILKNVFSGNIANQYGGSAYISDMKSSTCYEKDAEKYATKAATDKNPKGYSEYFSKITPGYLEISGGEFSDSSAINGGAFYVSGGNITFNNGNIQECVASDKGGAIYLSGGNFTMLGGNLGRIENDKKLGCKAIQGGALFVTGGNFTMNGGGIEGNTATESGGGIQVSDGNVYITGGKISSNVARGEKGKEEIEADVGYGGGIYVDGGEIVSITGGEISNNVAAKNGGGIEIKTDKVVTVDVYSGSFIDNVADDCGGAVGIDCDNGTINVGKEDCDGSNNGHIHPMLSGNLAGKQGGGFYMSGKDAILNIYCGTIDNNIVVSIENNFDQSSGVVTVYEGVEIGEENEGVIVVGGTFIDKRNQGEETVSLIYYCNFENSEEYKEAIVTKDASITLPADIFGVEDYEIVGWTTHKYNTTDIEYRAGEIIEITGDMELYAVWVLDEKNEPTYMIVIPPMVEFGNDTKKMEFDIAATLNLFPRTKVLNINLNEGDNALRYIQNGKVKDTMDFEITKENEKIRIGENVASFCSDTALISYEGREELVLTVIEKPRYFGIYEGDLTFFVSIEDV